MYGCILIKGTMYGCILIKGTMYGCILIKGTSPESRYSAAVVGVTKSCY
jgi:hypothetical protein